MVALGQQIVQHIAHPRDRSGLQRQQQPIQVDRLIQRQIANAVAQTEHQGRNLIAPKGFGVQIGEAQ